MAGAFPTLSGGTTVMYPLRLTVSCLTRVQRGTNAEEQRYAVRAPYAMIEATYTNLIEADRAAIQSHFETQKGMFDSTWTLAFDSKTFTAMRFMEDELAWEENKPNLWSATIRCMGLYPAISSPPSTLPALPSGAVTQLPWSKRTRFETNYTDMESGTRHALAFRGGGLTNFPTGVERQWDIRVPSTRPATAESFIKFFIDKHGRLGTFDFTDPDTTTLYTGCRFTADELVVSYVGYNLCSVNFGLVKT